MRPRGTTAFGSPEAIGTAEVDLFAPHVAFDPATGRPTAAWNARPKVPVTPEEVDNAVDQGRDADEPLR